MERTTCPIESARVASFHRRSILGVGINATKIERAAPLGAAYDVVMDAMAQQVPLGRVSTPEDIAEAVLSIITGSDFVTGQILVCDGGMLIKG